MIMQLLKKFYPRRPEWSHKGYFGRLLVVGGSRIYSGSPALSALAAYRAGCDLVAIAAPERAANIIASFSPDIIAVPLKGDYLSPMHLKEIYALMKSSDALVIGGGLCRSKATLSAISQILKKAKMPCVVDADAIYAVSGRLGSNFVITPHSKEFHALTAMHVGSDDRMEKTRNAARRFCCTILLKGHVDIISDGTRIAENKTGSAYMTKAGTGDVLAGVCGALLARIGSGLVDLTAYDAACCAAYISGKAGELCGSEAMLASEMIEKIGEVVRHPDD